MISGVSLMKTSSFTFGVKANFLTCEIARGGMVYTLA